MHVVESNIENFHPKKSLYDEFDNSFCGAKIYNVALICMQNLFYIILSCKIVDSDWMKDI